MTVWLDTRFRRRADDPTRSLLDDRVRRAVLGAGLRRTGRTGVAAHAGGRPVSGIYEDASSNDLQPREVIVLMN